ncbi:hypothetical protein [Sphingomonas sp.]|uniref:hypothetical protein n=1 Tax=Sphingomonas sp. TaxID=28214 RepID=UPI001B1DE14A|nr:hypothetical protein [Sphingomonas sp.]MBO9712886.1 hypothetical protein [Sphingomonas sp.]
MTDTPGNDTTPATTATAEKSFLEQAQEAIGDAIEATVEAAKEHPVAAAAIAAGATAAVAGAAYGISQLLGSDEDDGKKG